MPQQILEAQVASLVTDLAAKAAVTSVQQGSYNYATDTGAANAYAVTLSPVPTIVAGSTISFIAVHANSGASTLAVNGGSATPIKKQTSIALVTGDILAGQIITVKFDGTNWQVPAAGTGGIASPLTTKGDLYGFDTANNRIPIGSNGNILIADSSQALGLKWGAAPVAVSVTTKGDLQGFDTAANRIPVGSDGAILTADSTQTLGLKWSAKGMGVVGFGISGSSVVATGAVGRFPQIPFAGTITGWAITGDVSGSISIDVWKVASSAPPSAPVIPTSGNKISASAPIAISTAQSAAGGTSAVSTWTTAVAQWDVFGFTVASATSIANITVEIYVQRS